MADPVPRPAQAPTTLKRSIGLPLLTLYGVGNLIGGGFYALMGKVSALAGPHLPVAFLLAALIAGVSALSFSELSARYPRSAGPASYVEAVFSRRALTLIIAGIMVVTGMVSAATLASAIDGFVQDLLPHPAWVGIALTVTLLTGVAVWGVSESVALAVIITLIETGGIVYVGVVAAGAAGASEIPAASVVPDTVDVLPGIMLGAFLSFYAYVGFEDLVTMAEEVKRPERTLPRAILISVVVTTLLYVVVGTLSILVVPASELAESRTPLATVVEYAGRDSAALSYISVLAGINGALVQIIMGARVIYGLGTEDARFEFLARVNPRTRTPVRATLLVGGLILVLALFFPLVALARTTSFLLLIAFAVVNLALWILKRRKIAGPENAPDYPAFVPVLGTFLCVVFLAVEAARVLGLL